MSAPHPPDVAFPIHYVLNSGRPPLDLEVLVEADGRCVLDVRTGWSVPQPAPLRLGRFAGQVDAESLAALQNAAAASSRLTSSTEPYESATRLIGSGRGDLEPVDDRDAGIGSFEDWLRTKALEHLATPVTAVEVGARQSRERAGEVSDDAGAAELVITGIGPTPMPILFVEPGTNEWLRVWSDGPEGPLYLEYEDVERLVAAGAIPPGVVEVGSGTTIKLPLPAPGPSAAGIRRTGGFYFWWAGPADARTVLQGEWSL